MRWDAIGWDGMEYDGGYDVMGWDIWNGGCVKKQYVHPINAEQTETDDGMEGAMGWDGMGWDEMGWDGMGWDGMRWDGMG